MKRRLRFILAGLLLAGSAADAEAPSEQHWTRVDDPHAVPCIGETYKLHVPPDFMLVASSSDKRVTWAITAGQSGLATQACIDHRIEQRIYRGKIRGDEARFVAAMLRKTTVDLLANRLRDPEKTNLVREAAAIPAFRIFRSPFLSLFHSDRPCPNAPTSPPSS